MLLLLLLLLVLLLLLLFEVLVFCCFYGFVGAAFAWQEVLGEFDPKCSVCYSAAGGKSFVGAE